MVGHRTSPAGILLLVFFFTGLLGLGAPNCLSVTQEECSDEPRTILGAEQGPWCWRSRYCGSDIILIWHSDFFSGTPETCLVNRPARIAVYSVSYVLLIVAIIMDCYRLVTIRQNLLFIPPSALIRDGRTVQIMQWMNLLHLVNESVGIACISLVLFGDMEMKTSAAIAALFAIGVNLNAWVAVLTNDAVIRVIANDYYQQSQCSKWRTMLISITMVATVAIAGLIGAGYTATVLADQLALARALVMVGVMRTLLVSVVKAFLETKLIKELECPRQAQPKSGARNDNNDKDNTKALAAVKRVRLVSILFTLACTILDIMVVIFPRLLSHYIAFQWFYAATWSLFNRLFLGSPKKLQKNMNDIIGHGVLSDAESDMITTVGEMSDTMHSKTVPSAVSDDDL